MLLLEDGAEALLGCDIWVMPMYQVSLTQASESMF